MIRLAELEAELDQGGRDPAEDFTCFDEALASVEASLHPVDPGSTESAVLLGVCARLYARRAYTSGP